MIALPPWILATLITWRLAATSATAQGSPQAQLLDRTALDNGLQVIVVENHTVPLATVLLAVRAGAVIQRPGEEGLAHLYEHIVLRAYQGDPHAFEGEVARLNGVANAATREDVVSYYVIVPSAKTADAIRLLGRLILRARFGRTDLEEERPIVLDELERAESNPERALERRTARQLWGDAWYRKDVGGDSASLERITLDRLKQAFARYYVPNNAALIVTGDVSAPAVFAAAHEHFGEWKRGPDPFADVPPPPSPHPSGSTAVVRRADAYDVTIIIALQGPSLRADTASMYAANALVDVLNEPTSAFRQRLVASGLFRLLDIRHLTVDDAGSIRLTGTTSLADAQDALITLVRELDRFDSLPGVTADDLAIAKKRREVEAALAGEETISLASNLAFWWAGAGIDYYLAYSARIDGQTLDDLRRFARRYVVGHPRVIGVLGSSPEIDGLAEWLRRFTSPPP